MNLRQWGIAFLAVSGLIASGTALAGDADFTLLNETGFTIREIYISPSKKNSWGRDRLGDGVLEHRKSKLFRFSDKAACEQDIKVVFDDDGSEVVWEDNDLCEINKITIRYNRQTRRVSALKE